MNSAHQKEQARFKQLQDAIAPGGNIMYVGLIMQRSAQQFPERIALMYKDQSITYRDLYYRVCQFSKKLQESGVKKHDRVLLFFENSIEFYVAYYAILQAGAVVAPLNTFLREHELYHIVADAQPVLMISSQQSLALFHALDPAQRPLILTESDMDLESPIPAVLPAYEVTCLAADDMAALLYTSGTTGVPKGVMLSSRNIMSNLMQAMSRINLLPHERVLGILPLFHSFAQCACVWGSMFVGATVILVPKIDRRYLLEGLKHAPTVFLGVPALFGLLCLLKTAPIDNVRYFVSGGDSLPDKIRMYFALLYRRKICNGYGLSEASPVVSVAMEDGNDITSNIGRPLTGIECSFRDEEGKEVPQGEIGILWVKGDNVMLGYYNAQDKTDEVIKDGWLNTGDFAYMDTEGRLHIAGRFKDLIINKGINIYPPEIENVILTHPAVMRAAVIGKEDEAVGEIPVAYIEVREVTPELESALRELCVKNLAPYKVPRSFIIAEQLPLTAMGKVNKKKLKEELANKK